MQCSVSTFLSSQVKNHMPAAVCLVPQGQVCWDLVYFITLNTLHMVGGITAGCDRVMGTHCSCLGR